VQKPGAGAAAGPSDLRRSPAETGRHAGEGRYGEIPASAWAMQKCACSGSNFVLDKIANCAICISVRNGSLYAKTMVDLTIKMLFACCYPAVFAAVILLFSRCDSVKNVSTCSGLAPLAATSFGA
jgi:hypothetical protein